MVGHHESWESPLPPLHYLVVCYNESESQTKSWASQVVLVVKTLSANRGDERDMGSIPELAGSPGEGNGYPPQYCCLGNPWREEPGELQSMGSQRVRHN